MGPFYRHCVLSQFPCNRAHMHDHCCVHELSLVMSNGLALGWEAADNSSICYYLPAEENSLGWTPAGEGGIRSSYLSVSYLGVLPFL